MSELKIMDRYDMVDFRPKFKEEVSLTVNSFSSSQKRISILLLLK
jgi:hypothetical protein